MQEQLTTIWQDTLAIIKSQLNATTFKTWFASTRPVSISGNKMIICAPNDFAREWLESRYVSLISGSLFEVIGEELSVEFVSDDQKPRDHKAEQVPPPAPIVAESSQKSSLNKKYSFDSFVIGASNRFAHAAALAVAEAPSRAYNPLFIYGGVGLGKTHLLQAIGHYVFDNYRHLKIKYVSSEKFTNDFINSIRDKEKIVGFQKKYRSIDVLLVDDIQFLENKEATQEEFFHTFNTLHEANKQIIISSDRPPKDISTLEDRLRTRFESGLIVDIQPPDIETRIAILRKRVKAESLIIGNDVLEYIASKIQSNIRELEGALIRIVAFSSLTSNQITLTLAEEVLRDVFPSRESQTVSIALIQTEVCSFFRLSKADLVGNKRSQPIVIPRQIAMYLSRELTDASLPKIGSEFGKRDHTTVLHATHKIKKLMNEERELYNQIQALTNKIKRRC